MLFRRGGRLPCWECVWNQHTVEIHFAECFCHLIHVLIAVVNEGLDEVREGLIYVAEMDFENLVPFPESSGWTQ